MAEGLSFSHLRYGRLTALAGVTLALIVSGCARDTIYSAKATIESCGDRDYHKKIGNTAVKSSDEIIAKAREDAITLRERAQRNNDSLDVDRYPVDEVGVSSENLTLYFNGDNGWGDVDSVVFKIQHGTPLVTAGSVLCSAKNGLYPNGTFQALEEYAQETAALDR